MVNKEQIRQIQAYVQIHAADAGTLGGVQGRGESDQDARTVAQHSWNSVTQYLDEITETDDDYHISHDENNEIVDLAQRYTSAVMDVESLRQKKAAGPFTEVDQEFSKELDAKIESAIDKRDHAYDTLEQYLNTLLIVAENPQGEDPLDGDVKGLYT